MQNNTENKNTKLNKKIENFSTDTPIFCEVKEDKRLKKSEEVSRSVQKIKITSGIFNGVTGLFSSICFIVLLVLIIYIIKNGSSTLSWDMIVSDYNPVSYRASDTLSDNSKAFDLPTEENGVFYSKEWGVGFGYSQDNEGKQIIIIAYVDASSPMMEMVNKNVENATCSLQEGAEFTRLIIKDENGIPKTYGTKNTPEELAFALDGAKEIYDISFQTLGGGIRGSLVTTIYLILLTLLIVIPLGVIAAIYLAEYAPKNKFTDLVRSMIDMISGIPSVIFGLVAMGTFVPFVSSISGNSGGSILAGAFTLSIMLLPAVIRTTEEAIHTIPSSYREASLALGASKTETTFKIVLPNALPGILTSVLLCIGRIIGESAALIFAIGSIIKDDISITSGSSTLAVHIWTVMQGEVRNVSQACAISIIILVVVLVLNIFVKLIAKKLNRCEVK